MAQGGEAQLRRRRGSRLLKLLDIGGNMHALNRRELRHALRMKPVEEFDRRPRIGGEFKQKVEKFHRVNKG
jgi:hypothetical protein